MGTPRVILYFDIGSPFSYIAFHALKTSPTFSNCDVEYIPILLRDLFQKCNNAPPIAVKNKFQWINRERLYWSRRFRTPMSEAIPDGFSAPTSEAQIVLSLVAKESPEKVVSIASLFFHEFWVKADTKIAMTANFAPLVEKELGLEISSRILKAAQASDARKILDDNTHMAFDSGAFGLPWFECTNSAGDKEAFWGIDHLGRVADFLGLHTSLDDAFRVLL